VLDEGDSDFETEVLGDKEADAEAEGLRDELGLTITGDSDADEEGDNEALTDAEGLRLAEADALGDSDRDSLAEGERLRDIDALGLREELGDKDALIDALGDSD
jgi:hypothetical protein